MVKAYLRYEQTAAFGVIFSPSSSVILDKAGRLAICGAVEALQVWNVKQGVLVSSFCPPKENPGKKPISVSAIAAFPDDNQVAVGYSDGSIRIWDIRSGQCKVALHGHKSGVTCLRVSSDGSRLGSGSNDTDIIVWDIISQTGLYRLRGHVSAITDICFVNNRLLSASKDTFIKVWEMDTQHCVQTLTGHRNEVWSLDVDSQMKYLVSGASEAELYLWEIQADEVKLIGPILRNDTSRISQVRFHGNFLGVQGTGKVLELWQLRSEAAMKKHITRRLKRARENRPSDDSICDAAPAIPQVLPKDALEHLNIVRTESNQRSFAFSANKFAIGLANNAIHVYNLKGLSTEATVLHPCHMLEDGGHRGGVRAASLSRDETVLATVSNGSIKVWNLQSHKSIRTLSSGYGLCCAFVPGDQHVLVGTKTGDLELYSIGAAEITQRVKAHTGAVWSMDMHPNGCGFATGGADKEVKFWAFELVDSEDTVTKKRKKTLGFVHTRTLRLVDDVMCVKFSPNGKYIAASLLDSTIKVFHEDSLKFFLSLYGHKLPVLSMDISSDGTLLCSAGADKSLKIWGLDFGDCHKSLLAHDDSVMSVKFLPDTHYVFTCSKDKQIRFWDVDKFEHVFSLEGHHSEIWGLAVSKSGQTLVSVGNDRSIRKWSQTEQQIFLDVERENRLEEAFEEAAIAKPAGKIGALPNSGLPDPSTFESVPALEVTTTGTVKTGERLMEAIDFIEADKAALAEATLSKKKHIPHLMLLGLPSSAFLLKVLRASRPSELDIILMVLPFAYAKRLMVLLEEIICAGDDGTELCVRCAMFLIQLHHQRMIASNDMLTLLSSLKQGMREQLRAQKDLLGFNIAALSYLKRDIEWQSNSIFFEDRRTLTGS